DVCQRVICPRVIGADLERVLGSHSRAFEVPGQLAGEGEHREEVRIFALMPAETFHVTQKSPALILLAEDVVEELARLGRDEILRPLLRQGLEGRRGLAECVALPGGKRRAPALLAWVGA